MTHSDLTTVLEDCRQSAKRGQKIASSERQLLDKALTTAEDKISQTVIEFRQSPCETAGMTELLESQLENIRGAMNDLKISFNENLDLLAENMGSFSITLFGRTMAGKSTLMEVLTEGDGMSIGKGAQRTTRDIRRYEWNGLSVTDVPGIGAFEGEEDTRLAFDAAKTADLILFLLTDDAPQAIEADCFRQVVELGKPVIVIMNVKVSVEGGKSLKLAERDMRRAFDEERLSSVRRQFLKFAEPMGQDWSKVKFVFVHLKAAYIAQNTEDADERTFWQSMSRIDDLKELLIEQVSTRGKFIRIKTFVDVIANPMIAAIDELEFDSRLNCSQGEIIKNKRKVLDTWKKSFIRESKRRIEAFMMKLKTDLRFDIAGFAEDHYNDRHADLAWGEVIRGKNIEEKCRVLLDSFELTVDDMIKETVRELHSELKYVSVDAIERNFLTPALVDSRKIVSWTALAAGTGLSVTAAVLAFVGTESAMAAMGPIGWIAAGVGLAGGISLLFLENRNDKELRARGKLEKELNASVNATCDSIWSQLENNLKNLVNKKIEFVSGEFDKMGFVTESLAQTQDNLAEDIKGQMRVINRSMIIEMVKITEGLAFDASCVKNVARIPGVATLIVTGEDTVLPSGLCENLSDMISEDVTQAARSESSSDEEFARLIMGDMASEEDIYTDEEKKIVIIKCGKKDPAKQNRIRLLTQLINCSVETGNTAGNIGG